MELRQLRYLDAVLELGTFAAAAEREHVTQPALWQQVRALEREWRIPLFERAGRRVRPTPAAVAIRPQVQSILASADQLTGAVSAVGHGLAVPARYAAPRYARSAVFVFETIARYRAHHPDAPLPVAVPIGTADTLGALTSGRVDLAAAVPSPGWRLRSEPLYEVWVAVVGPEGAAVLEIEDLADRPLALLTPEYQSRQLVEDMFRRRGLRPSVAVEHASPDVVLAAARSGLATAVLVSDSLPIGYDGPVGELRDGGEPLGGLLSLVWRDDERLSPAANKLKEEAIAYAREVRAGTGPVPVGRPMP
jgi:DNA-binding transcriptional LysR family regulator